MNSPAEMHARSGLGRFARTPGTVWLVCAIGALIAIAITAWSNGRQIERTDEQLRVTRTVHEATDALLVAVTNAETGQRGYLLTGDPHYLEPFNQAILTVPGLIARLDGAARSPDQRERVAQLRPLITDKLAELRQTIDLRSQGATAAAVAIVRTDRGKAIMDALRTRITRMNQVSDERLIHEQEVGRRTADRLTVIGTTGLAALLMLLVVASITVYRGTLAREKIHDEMVAARDTLQVTLSSIGDAVIATDVQARVTFMNAVAEGLTGWKEDEARHMPLARVFHIVNETTRAPVEDPIGKALRHGTAVGLANHTVLLSRDGRSIPIDDSASPIRTDDGTLLGGVLIFRDISQRRKTEIEREELLGRLNRSNEDLQRFAYAAAHDLRSPVNTVSALCELLARRSSSVLDMEGRDLLATVNAALKRMSELISDLLAFSRASSPEENPSLLKLDEVLDAAIEDLKPVIDASGAVIGKGPLPEVVAHRALLMGVFQNLVDNSLKYRQSDTPPRVEITAEKDGSFWTIAVKDNGMGFQSEYSTEIFKPFRRLHGPEVPGSGIGLSSCKAIVERYGGRIWAESEPGAGAVFYFTIPVAAESDGGG